MERLSCAVQRYAWGKQGTDSLVLRLAQSGGHVIGCEDDVMMETTFAELWMGTHVNGPSRVVSADQSLLDYIRSHPDLFHNLPDLKYLFKVLSVNKPLSIQIHPDKAWARRLHADQPDVYRDDNHKPEMAIALTPFRALCGFRPAEEINGLLSALTGVCPEVERCLGASVRTEEELRTLFMRLMSLEQATVTLLIEALVKDERTPLRDLLHSIHTHFPHDRGALCIYLLHYFELQEGEALFLQPLTPHAYLSGDCIECMALSDNVVRAGLTPKPVDLPALQAMTSYRFSSKADYLVAPRVATDFNRLYLPPGVHDFAVHHLKVTSSHSEAIPRDGRTRILLVVKSVVTVTHLDSSEEYPTGSAVLLLPHRDFTLSTSVLEGAEVFVAF